MSNDCIVMLYPGVAQKVIVTSPLASLVALKPPAVSVLPFSFELCNIQLTARLCSASSTIAGQYGQKGWENKELFFRYSRNLISAVTQPRLTTAVSGTCSGLGAVAKILLPLPDFCLEIGSKLGHDRGI